MSDETPIRESLTNKKLSLEISNKEVELETNRASLFCLNRTVDGYKRVDRIFSHRGMVDDLSLSLLSLKVAKWRELDRSLPFKVEISSHGGSVFHGFAHYDLIRDACNDGLNIESHIQGYAASMASAYAQAANHRTITKGSWLMIHEASLVRQSLIGLAEMKDQLKLFDALQAQIVEYYAERSTLSADEISERCNRRDWWITSEEALKYGFIDEITGSNHG